MKFTSIMSKVAIVSATRFTAPALSSHISSSMMKLSTAAEMEDDDDEDDRTRRRMMMQHDSTIGANIPNVLQNMIQTGVLNNNNDSTSVDADVSKEPLKLAVVYDLDAIDSTIDILDKSFPGQFQHRFAVKSCPLSFFLKRIIDAGMGMECASLMEVKHALRLGCDPEKIVFDSPCKTEHDLVFALRTGVMINADSFAELDVIMKILKRDGYFEDDGADIPVIGLRINPLIGYGSNQYLSVSQSTSKFGIPLTEENRSKIIELFQEHSFLKALHCHVGSQGCGLEMLATGAEIIQKLADDIDAVGGQVTTLNIGGGLPVNFSDDEFSPTYGEYAAVLEDKVPSLFHGKRTILTEYGRSVCAKTSWTVSEVEYVKTSDELRIGIIHAGSDLFLRTCYVPELFPHRLEVFTKDGKPSMAPHTKHNIAGPLCFGGDILGRDVDIPAVEPGDYVVVKDTGSNTMSMFSRHCSRPAPAIYGYRSSKTGGGETTIKLELLKPQETLDDVLKFWG